MSFGANLISLRKRNGLSRQELAARLNIPYTTLRNYETDQREPGHRFLIQIAKMFSVSVDSLIGLDSKIKPVEGEMFTPSPERSIDELIQAHGLDDLDRKIITEFIKLRPEDREAVKRYVRNLAQHLSAAQAAPVPERPEPESRGQEIDMAAIDAQVELYRQQLLFEQEQKSQALSVKESGAG